MNAPPQRQLHSLCHIELSPWVMLAENSSGLRPGNPLTMTRSGVIAIAINREVVVGSKWGFVMRHTERWAPEAHRRNACKLGGSFVCKFEVVAEVGTGLSAGCALDLNL